MSDRQVRVKVASTDDSAGHREVMVRAGDASLIVAVAEALADPRRRNEARRVLASYPFTDLKTLLASAPLEGVHLRRYRDRPRAVRL